MLRRLTLLLLLCAFGAKAQTVTNGSFESPAPVSNYNYSCPTGWTCAGQYWGIETPTVAQLPVVPDGKSVLWAQGATITQDLGPSDPTQTYTLTYYVGSQTGFPIPKTWGASLSIPCTQTGAIPLVAAALTQQTMTCTGAGELILTLVAGPTQVMFDNVVLTATPITPPKFDTLTFGVQLVNCTKCDGSDATPLVSGSIFAGATLKLTQDSQNVCNATFNSSAQATCTGPVNVTPAMVNLVPVVLNPAGNQLNTGQTISLPSLLAGGAVTGNIKLILGFDSVTMLPRSFQIFTQ
jgi:hypothetical protein